MLPRKWSCSVRTDTAEAPPVWYASRERHRIEILAEEPWEGEAFLTSAMTCIPGLAKRSSEIQGGGSLRCLSPGFSRGTGRYSAANRFQSDSGDFFQDIVHDALNSKNSASLLLALAGIHDLSCHVHALTHIIGLSPAITRAAAALSNCDVTPWARLPFNTSSR